jgi:FlaA1/EpsC-like NDP-sugar epimerase
VVPTFRSQIAKGGPVTVTHPEITRYFMTIPEAVQLVLRAVTMAKGGEIFVLDMGKPVRLVDMARNLIRAAGFVPDQDIAIKFIGLRPGEKLHEELVGVDEKVEATDSSRILRICPSNHQNQDALLRHIQAMENLAIHGKSDDLIKMLCSIVPNFTADAHSPEADDVSQIAS